MTKQELADRLTRLDPGGAIRLDRSDLATLFGNGALSRDVLKIIEDFAVEHRCTFVCDEHGHDLPSFQKDDVY